MSSGDARVGDEAARLKAAMSMALALWQRDALSTEATVAWADAQILRSASPPQELLDLSLDGPAACSRKPLAEFGIRPAALSFAQEVAIRADAVSSLDDDGQIMAFAEWLSRSCIGQDPADPDAGLGYRLDHLRCDCHDPVAAVALLRAEWPGRVDRWRRVAVALVEGLDCSLGAQGDGCVGLQRFA